MADRNTEKFVLNANGEEEATLPVAVIDTSYLISALLSPFCSDEALHAQQYIETLIEAGGQIVVPQLFWFEVGNVLLNAARPRKNSNSKTSGSARITQVQLAAIELNLSQLPIYTDPQPTAEVRLRIRDIALNENFTYYDATYLELARRENVPLMTLDVALMKAANTK